MKHLLAAARQCALRIPAEAAVCCAAAFLLTAVSTGGQYAPWALAAVAVAGVGWRGLAATACAGVGALAFLDFQPGLRHAAAAVLIFCANTAFCPSRLYRHPRFRPTAAVCAAALTQLPYLIARSGREWLLCGASLALLGDAVDSIGIALTPSPGYPVSFTLSGYQNALPLAGGFVAVGDKDLAIYSAGGNEVRRIQHGYGRPAITAGNTRVCVYNRAGKELRVESRSRTLFENKFDDAIQLCAMSPNGTLAVFTKSKLYVYDPMFENIYTFQTQDLPTALAFAGDNRQFAAGCPYAEGGALGGTVYLMDTRKDEYVTIRNTEGMPVKIQYLTNAEVLVLYDTYAAVYDTADGTELYRYSYGGRTLQSAAISAGKNAVLLFGDGVHGALTQLTILDATLSEAGSADVNERASGVAASRTGAFVLTNDGVLSYGLDGVFYGATVTEAKPLAMVNGRKLLLLEQGEVSVFEPPAPPSASAG